MEDQQKSSDNGDHQQKVEEIVLPGFRFHPTDEELVGFYLKRKIQQRPLSIELIKQLDIYKFDPWDLPKMAAAGEKEWYFFCPRDRKYRNSARPNRVTRAGFWKATGTDRPVYSTADGSSPKLCIGLKKSLVFYKGRAAKGVKTDWMMHEFRLPSVNDQSLSFPPKIIRSLDKSIPTSSTESWAICRIFKKTTSVAQRSISQSWVSPSLPLIPPQPNNNNPTTSNNNKSPPNPYHNHFNSLPSKPPSFPSTHHTYNLDIDSSPYLTQDSHGLFNLTSYNTHNKPTTFSTNEPNHSPLVLHNFPTHADQEFTSSYQMLLPPLVDALPPQLEPPPTPSPPSSNHDHLKISDISPTLGFCEYRNKANDILEPYNSLEILHEQMTRTNSHDLMGVNNFSQDEAVRVMDRFDRGDDLWDVVQSIGGGCAT